MTFTVKETGRTFIADGAYLPILILTSNSERDLPDAFLRRCVFYNIPFPDRQQLIRILANRVNRHGDGRDLNIYEAIVELFAEIRMLRMRKKPGTAELIAWTRLLAHGGATYEEIRGKNAARLLPTVPLIAKNPEDRHLLIDWIGASRT